MSVSNTELVINAYQQATAMVHCLQNSQQPALTLDYNIAQVDVEVVEAALLDTSSGCEVIPSLRVAAAAASCSIGTDTTMIRPACEASAMVPHRDGTKSSIDMNAKLSSKYFNSSLHVEETLLQVRCFLISGLPKSRMLIVQVR